MKSKLLAPLVALALCMTTTSVPAAVADTAALQSIQSAGTSNVAALEVNIPDGLVAFMYGDLTMRSEATTALQQVRDLRAKAWDANPTFEFFSLRDYSMHVVSTRDAAAFEGLHSKEAYQNAISWDPGLEQAVIQRAAEENESMDHKRPDGSDTPVLPGVGLGENLTTASMRQGVASFESGEWNKLMAGNWQEAGHVTNMLNPAFRSYAQAQVGGMTAQLFTWSPTGKPAATLSDGRYAFPMTFKEDAISRAELQTGTTYLNESGQLQVTIPGFRNPAALPGRYSSSNPSVFDVKPNGSFTAVAEGNATAQFTPLRLVNGQVVNSSQTITRDVTVAKRPAGPSEGSSAGPAVGIIAAVLALFGLLATMGPKIMQMLPH